MKQKGFGLWILFFVFGTALLFFFLSSLPPPTAGDHLVHQKKIMYLTKPIRKLKEENHDENANGNMDVDDYLPNDPVPSSKATSLRPGPIEHGTPLMPYIPKPAPPGPNEPGYDGSP
uniref:uncharacterized protein LOC122590291 n=1 Tax=Erigeron canadensis TaxID=72917 RepID=UPI001CB9121C|nr:uncharacterized protein LOC122590291 [Erigeron canadensis]XP_043618551.1 uncharacterized protein LOC122590291 [Erigeron canadensis]